VKHPQLLIEPKDQKI